MVDGGGSDGTFDLAQNHCDRCLHATRGRAAQMNAGARAASGDTLWFLHADCEVPAGCLEQTSPALRDPQAVGGFFRISIPNEGVVYRLTDSLAPLCRSSFAHAFSATTGSFADALRFEEMRRFPKLPLMEDAEFFCKLRRLGRMDLLTLL